MTTLNANSLRAVLLAVPATLMVACGGSSGDGDSNSSAATPARLTPNGATLKIGAPALVKHDDLSPAGAKLKSRIVVTPTKLEKGEDFGDVDLEPSQKDSTPYYVEAEVKNIGPADLSGTDPTLGNLTGLDERDESLTSLSFIGDFKPCNSADAPETLKQGESFKTCLVFLVPKGGGSLAKVQWSAGEVLWKP